MTLKNLHHSFASLFFFLLFPFFYVFHFISAWSGFGFYTGIFAEVSLLSVFVLGFCFVKKTNILISSCKRVSLPFTLLIILCIFWTIYFYITNWNLPDAAFYQVVGVIVSWCALFLIGAHLVFEEKTWYLKINYLFVVFVSVTIILFVDYNYMIMDPRSLFDRYPVSYQGFSRSLMVVAFALISFSKISQIFRYFIIIYFIALIFLLGARSELYGFIFSIFLFEIIRCVHEKKKIIYSLILFLLFVFLLIVNFDNISSSRQLNVLDLSTDDSWNERKIINDFAINQILENPIIGKFGGQFYIPIDVEPVGAYAHNWFSSWVSFGIFGFLIYAYLNICTAIITIRKIINRKVEKYWEFSFYLCISSTILVIFSRSVFWPIPALGWGLVVGSFFKDKSKRRSSIETQIQERSTTLATK